jgi:tyrosine-protein kinase Etk/Wzc
MSDENSQQQSSHVTRAASAPEVVYAVTPASRRENQIDLLDVIGVLWRRKWLIIGFTFLVAALMVAFAVVSIMLPPEVSPLPNLYRPRALVLVHENESDSLSSLLSSSAVSGLAGALGVPTATGPTQSALAQRLATSDSFLDQIAEEFDFLNRYNFEKYPRTEARDRVRENLSLGFDPDSGTMTISYEDWDAELATEIVNRVLELLDQRMAAVGSGRNNTRLQLLEQKIAETEVEVARLEAEVESFQQRYNALTVEQLAEEQARALGELRGRAIAKEIEIATYGDFAGGEDPVLRRLQAERDNLVQLIHEYEEGFQRYEGLLPAQQDLPAIAVEFARLERELRIQETIFQTLRQQYEVTRIAQGGTTTIFQVLDVAEVPERKSGPARSILVILGTFAGFFVSVVLAFLVNAAANIRSDPDARRRISGRKAEA